MPDRYFTPSPVTSYSASLAGAEAHHLLHVMRAKAGTRVTLFDGSGWEFDAIVKRAGRGEIEVAVIGRRQVDREAKVALMLGVVLPRGERQKWLVEKLVELGAAKLVPLKTARGVAQPGGNSLERLRRGVVEASKQCGRNRLMEIAEPMAWTEFVAGSEQVACRIVAHPGNALWSCPVTAQTAALAVGPEGGFTDDEVAEAVAQGWLAVGLGPRILRVETAAVAMAARLIGWEG